MSWSTLAAALVMSFIGGVAGALATWALRDTLDVSDAMLLAFIGWMVTLAGWFVNALLARKGQERMFLHGIINTARLDVVAQIRREQDWLISLNTLTFHLSMKEELANTPGIPQPEPVVQQASWVREVQSGLDVLHRQEKPRRSLLMILEEYEVIFPETRVVRVRLADRGSQISERFSKALLDIVHNRAAALDALNELSGARYDYSALLEDLRIHIQNASLSTITGNSVPARQPKLDHLPRMVVNSAGLLEIRPETMPASPATDSVVLAKTNTVSARRVEEE